LGSPNTSGHYTAGNGIQTLTVKSKWPDQQLLANPALRFYLTGLKPG
jgi:hypothetical protein